MKAFIKLIFRLFILLFLIAGCSVFKPCPCRFSEIESENSLYEVGKFDMAQIVPEKE
ncbi:hypothetical protein [Alkalitalea saponilacus]|uniref:hypothetical protein n=1 Tax=Alkalitalea saponilacus TaxID=889453 RepID=UPI0012FA2F6D|nr:hypothetical protein [Alkalitalea saponilacus]